MTILAVTGLAREARIVAGPGIEVVTGAGNAQLLSEKLNRSIAKGVCGVISIGIAGGLAPSLKPGDCVVASEVAVPHGECFQTDAAWTKRMIARLPHGMIARVTGADTIIGIAGKAALYRATSAFTIDMESHITAELAAERGVPFVVLRVVSDAADSDLPPAASVALGHDGRVKLSAVLASVIRRPGQVPALVRTARDSKAAFAALLRCRNALGIGLAGPDVA